MKYPINYTDYYKVGHVFQFPKGTELVYSNLTARTSRIPGIDNVVNFGLQFFIKEFLIKRFNQDFFNQPKEEVLKQYKRRLDNSLGKDTVSMDHISALHDLGYLPVEIKALPEGSIVPLRVPLLTIVNTLPEFYWVTNFLETILSCSIWHPMTSATIAYEYKKILDQYAAETSDIPEFVSFQGHDFSMRGHTSLESASASGAAHLLSFAGSDTIPAIDFLEEYYAADCEKELIAGSVPATEHAVQCMGSKESEYETYERLITEVYPKGIVSIVSDTWDYWNVLTKTLPSLKDKIMARDGKLVVRPDSGDPVKIICGDNSTPSDLPEHKGSIELLWEIFGGTINSKGYKQLDPHIGLIYGDSITIDRCKEICKQLKDKGFASTNVVFGIGSYCVGPETPILCADLVWRKACEIKVGQEIIAFDEDPKFGENKHAARCYKKAKITANNLSKKQCSIIKTDIGPAITASNDHPWLVWAHNRSVETIYYNGTMPSGCSDRKKYPRGAGLIWKKTSELKEGDQIAFLTKPWEKEDTRNGGWLAGMYDGEGCVSRSTGNDRVPSWKINISQNQGPVLEKIKYELINRGFEFYINKRKCPQITLTGGWIEVLRFLGSIYPQRLITKLSKIMSNMPALKRDSTFKLATISEVESIGNSSVSSISTSSGTFITGGYLSHNTYQHVTRDTFGFAIKATYGEINGKPVEIFKDPATDNGVKKSARGLLAVIRDTEDGDYKLVQQCTKEQEQSGYLATVFKDGILIKNQTLSEIRKRLLT